MKWMIISLRRKKKIEEKLEVNDLIKTWVNRFLLIPFMSPNLVSMERVVIA